MRAVHERSKRPLDRSELAAITGFAVVLLALSAPVVVASLTVSPDDIESGRVRIGGPCPYQSRTGQGCPTCGLTRGIAAAGHGRFVAAWRYHPAAPALFVVACSVALGSSVALGWAGRRLVA